MGFKQYPKVKRVGDPSTEGLFREPDHELVVTEKIDGNNFRFTYDMEVDNFRFGSRNQDLGTDPAEIGGQFDAVSDHIIETVNHDTFQGYYDGYDGLVVFGENFVEHTIDDYHFDDAPQFHVFDMFVGTAIEGNHDGRRWLPWDEVVTIANALGLATAPVVERTTVDEWDPNDVEIPASEYRPDERTAEGVVVRNQHNQVRAKMISDEFAELHASAKSKTDYEDTDTRRFVTEYCPPQRIKKRAFALRDDPESEYDCLEMPMMEVLATDIWNDLWEEEWEEIIYENYELDIGEARSMVSSRTASVLQDMIRERTIDA